MASEEGIAAVEVERRDGEHGAYQLAVQGQPVADLEGKAQHPRRRGCRIPGRRGVRARRGRVAADRRCGCATERSPDAGSTPRREDELRACGE